MWISPNHPDRERLMRPASPTAHAAPPDETGRRLATLARPNRQGRDAELRVSLDQYEGHDYISVRLWELDPDSGYWPVKGKGISIRMREAAEVAKALREAIRLVEAEAGGGSAPRASTPSRAGRPHARTQPALPEAAADGGGFDEFGGG